MERNTALREFDGVLSPQKLRAVRKKKKLSQTALAKEIGMAREKYNLWESATPPESYDFARMSKLLVVLGVPFKAISKRRKPVKPVTSR